MRIEKKLIIASAAIIILAVTVLYFTLTKERITYSIGDRWSWKVTRMELDPLTDNITSSQSYEESLELMSKEQRNNHDVNIFKLTRTDRPDSYGLVHRFIKENALYELGSESFVKDQKVSEYFYSQPILALRLPLKAGLRFSDSKSISGWDNQTATEIDAFETRVIEVIGKETLMLPAAIESYKLRRYGTTRGSVRTDSITSQVIMVAEETLWYSPAIKEMVKSITQTTTTVITPAITSVSQVKEERVLTSYSLK